jgi:hypothetical protein
MSVKNSRQIRPRLSFDATVQPPPAPSPRELPRRRGRLDSSQARRSQPSLVVPQTTRTPAVQHRSVREPAQPTAQHARILADLPLFIRQCREFSDYPIFQATESSFAPQPPVPALKAKTEALGTLFSILSDSALRVMLSPEFFKALFSALEPDLHRSIPAFTAPNAFSEVPTIYAVKNWNHVLFAHRIVQLMTLDREMFSPLLTAEFASFLVHQLETPVLEEREEVEAELHILLGDYVGFRRPMLCIMLAKLVAYLDGVKYLTLSIAPILRLLLTYFTTVRGPIKQTHFLLFRTVFYPLFTRELSTFYEIALTDLSYYFQGRDSATAFWCLRYLKTHWPRSNTQKQLLFFKQTALLIPLLPMTIFDRVGPVLLRTIRTCLTSEHFEVAMSAALFCAAPEFIDLLTAIPDEVSAFLMVSARAATAHWNTEAAELAQFLVDSLRTFEIASKPTTRARTARKKVRFGWLDVIKLAAKEDGTLDEDRERQKVEDWLQQIGPNAGTP